MFEMKKLVALVLVALCGSASAQQVTYKGEQADFSVVAENPKVAVFDIAASETVHALGGIFVGADRKALPEQPSDVKAVEQMLEIGGLKNPDIQKVKQAGPDLIIISGRQRSKVDSLSQIAPVLDASPVQSNYLTSLYDQVGQIAKVLGKTAEGEALIQELKKEVASDRKSTRL